jgi:mono/diheme cytochrome c family protein
MFGKKAIGIITAAFLCGCALLVSGQDQSGPATTIKHVPVKATSPVSGKEMFTAYCAVCHGPDGKGGGPAASALKVPPSDLTVLAKNNGGKYPSMKVEATIRGEATTAAHGSKDMPVWGPLFWNMSAGHSAEVQQRVANLSQYIGSLQAK